MHLDTYNYLYDCAYSQARSYGCYQKYAIKYAHNYAQWYTHLRLQKQEALYSIDPVLPAYAFPPVFATPIFVTQPKPRLHKVNKTKADNRTDIPARNYIVRTDTGFVTTPVRSTAHSPAHSPVCSPAHSPTLNKRNRTLDTKILTKKLQCLQKEYERNYKKSYPSALPESESESFESLGSCSLSKSDSWSKSVGYDSSESTDIVEIKKGKSVIMGISIFVDVESDTNDEP
jgi:hypothetical protein